MITDMRRCSICKQTKLIDQFAPTGHNCRPCDNKRVQKYRDKYPERSRTTATRCRDNLSLEHKLGGMRVCVDCKLEKDVREFSPSERRCHICATQRALKVNKRRRAKNQSIVLDYLLEHPCVDCGEADPVVLHFDHVRGQKVAAVSGLMLSTWDKIFTEIYKCDVRCANCHSRKTHKERGYYRAR